jgi:hypothetical protein
MNTEAPPGRERELLRQHIRLPPTVRSEVTDPIVSTAVEI